MTAQGAAATRLPPHFLFPFPFPKMDPIHSYQDLIIWMRGVDLAVAMFALTDRFPRTEESGLMTSIRRAAISIPAQIAAGHQHGGKKFPEALRSAYASAAELATYIHVAELTPQTSHCHFADAKALLDEEMKMLNALSHSLRPKNR